MIRFARIVFALSCLAAVGCRPGPATHAARHASTSAETSAAGRRPPNVIVILTDDQAPNTLGVEGNPTAVTPHLDSLARHGVFFSRAYVPTPLCAPSRAAMLTGLYPLQNGILANRPPPQLDPDAVTFPRLLKQAGYACGMIGKWHLGRENVPQAGFDDAWITPTNQAKPDYQNPTFWIDGQVVPQKGHLTYLLTEHAWRFIEEHADRPFLLWLAYQAPHGPWTPPPNWQALHRPARLSLPPSAADDLSTKPAAQRKGQPHTLFLETSPAEILRGTAAYHAHISCLDHNVGRLLEGLEELQLRENTVIVFLSDNGWLNGEHQMTGKDANFYEEQVRTPMIISWPGHLQPGRRLDALVSSLDLFPTICGFAGVPTPADRAGLDLGPLLAGSADRLRDALFFEYQQNVRLDEVPMRGLVTPSHKYVTYLDDGEELYDLDADPHEMENLILDPAGANLAATLRRVLAERYPRSDEAPRGEPPA